MSNYGPASLNKLETCCDEIVSVCQLVIPNYDHTIIWGYRGEEAQNAAFEQGYSTKRFPNSKHNYRVLRLDQPDPVPCSRAVDLAPWFPQKPHIRWDHEREFIYLAGHMMQAAAALGISMAWGGDWDRDKDLYDRNIPFDLGHFEIA